MGEKLFFSGKNLQQALLAASRKLGLRPEEIAYSDRTKAQGNLKGARAVVEVDGDQPRRSSAPVPMRASVAVSSEESKPGVPATGADSKRPNAPEPSRLTGTTPATRGAPVISRPTQRKPVEPVSPRGADRRGPPTVLPPEVPPEQVKEAAEEAVRLLAAVAGARSQPEARILEGTVQVDLSPSGRLAVSVTDEVLFALQHLLPRALRGLVGLSVPCRVDLAGARRVREEQLRGEALRGAQEALENLRAVALPPMGAADRRVVHMALRELPGIRTESEGAGETRAVVIRPA